MMRQSEIPIDRERIEYQYLTRSGVERVFFMEVAVMEWLATAADVAKDVMGIVAFLALVLKPVREFLFGTKALKKAEQCMLRSDMLRTYYRHREDDTIRQYEKENFLMEYAAYKALGGNSFIDDVKDEVRRWDVIT